MRKNFEQITTSFARHRGVPQAESRCVGPTDERSGLCDATLTAKAKMMDAQVPQCTGLLKKHGIKTHEYLVAIEVLRRRNRLDR